MNGENEFGKGLVVETVSKVPLMVVFFSLLGGLVGYLTASRRKI